LGIWVSGSYLRVWDWGSGIRVTGSYLRVWGFEVWGFGFQVHILGFGVHPPTKSARSCACPTRPPGVHGSVLEVTNSRFKVYGVGFKV
jgi:hypothetical protein